MDSFNARNVQPQQGVGGHPPGRFPFQITNTYAKENKDKTGAMLVVELTSDVGRIENRYNIWNQSAQAVEIAQKELSALCHATGIYQLNFPRDAQGNYDMANAARELRGGRGIMEVAPQTNRDGTPNGYMEVKKVFDAAGNEPGKQGSAPQTQPAQQQPSNGGWANSQPNPNQPPPNNPPAQPWGGQSQQASPPPTNNGGGWSSGPNVQQQPQGGAPAGNPPWGNK